MVLHQDSAPAAERRGDPVALVIVDDQIRVVEPADALGEQDAVVGEEREIGCGRTEGGRVGGMPVDDCADVLSCPVYAGVQHGLEVEDRVGVVERDDVVGFDLVERDALPLDPNFAPGPPCADVAMRSA